MSPAEQRKAFDAALAAMSVSSSPYFKDYVYYLHLIAQCKVNFREDLKAPAGVSFSGYAYILHINPIQFNKLEIPHTLGVLKHEMEHISLGHLIRVDDRNFLKYNYAADCALNQFIEKDHLPDWVIRPKNFPNKEAANHPFQTAEFYYDMLENEDIEDDSEESGSNGKGNAEGNGKEGSGQFPGNAKGKLVDDHDVWKEGEATDPDVVKEVTKKMVEKAAEAATKSRGNLPANYSQIIDNLTQGKEVSWQKVLKNIIGSKRANRRRTIKRRDRRNPAAEWIKGKIINRVFELGVISDVSGSVVNRAQVQLWGEVISVAKTFETSLSLVQVDTQPCPVETLTPSTKMIKRKACGGTTLHPAIEEFARSGIKPDCYLVTTDGYLSEYDVDQFLKPNVPVIWLINTGGQIMPNMNKGKMRAILLKGDKK